MDGAVTNTPPISRSIRKVPRQLRLYVGPFQTRNELHVLFQRMQLPGTDMPVKRAGRAS